MTTMTEAKGAPGAADRQAFLLKRVQPALSGLMDGSLSTLAPIFAVVLATHHPLTGSLRRGDRSRRGREHGLFRGTVRYRRHHRTRQSGAARRDHRRRNVRGRHLPHASVPIPGYGAAISAAVVVVAAELLTLAWLRHRYFQTSFARSFVAVAVGGTIIASLSAALGILAAR